MGTLIAHPENKEKLAALKAFMKALKIRFEEEKSPYNPGFVEKIKRSEEDFKAGSAIDLLYRGVASNNMVTTDFNSLMP